MLRRRLPVVAVVVAAALGTLVALWLLAAPPGEPRERFITLASTTSTDHSGLLAELIAAFRARTGINVRVLAVGTGQAFDIARRGDADVLLVHDREGEDLFIAQGHGLERRDVMYNDYVLLGPVDDPAGAASASGIAEALQRVAASGATFTSRGDDSGTHRTELRLWRLAGTEPQGRDWYRELGSGMGPTLNTTAVMRAYTLSDRATWARFGNPRDLVIVLADDPPMFNPYASLLINPERHPHLKHADARVWHAWLVSDEGQAAIADFRIEGQAVFFPNAGGRIQPLREHGGSHDGGSAAKVALPTVAAGESIAP